MGFENFKVTAHMNTPIASVDYIILDSVISCAVAKEKLKDEYYNGENKYGTKEEIDNWLGDILDKEKEVYCTSIGFGDCLESVTSWSKSFDSKNDDIINFTGKGKKRVDIGGGYFKNYHMPIVLKSFKTITFYVRGDMGKVKHLLENYIFYLGKKGSQGFGEVVLWEFEKIENDYSLFKDGDVMRPLPARLCDLENIENYKVQNYAIIPPYWREDNIELCVMPNSINCQEGVK